MYISHDKLLLLDTLPDSIPCLVAVFGLLGTALLYPGWEQVAFAAPLLDKPPFLSGLGPIYMSWAFVPALALVCVALLFLILRNRMRRRPFLQGALGQSMLLPFFDTHCCT